MANLKVGNALIDFTLPAANGQTINAYATLKGSVGLILVFMSENCPYVQAWASSINAIARDFAPAEMRTFAINPTAATQSPTDTLAQMAKWSQQEDFVFPYLYDENQQVARAYGIEAIPEIFIFDAVGILRYHGAIDDNSEDGAAVTNPYARKALAEYLDGKTVMMPETTPVGCPVEWQF